jgi:hypothetical protein
MGTTHIRTGNTEIDAIETRYTQDILIYQLKLENDTVLLNEDGESILWEYRIEKQDKLANNEYFTTKSRDFIDFSERSPFSEVDRF